MAPKPAVLITRPAGQTQALCAGLKSLGFLAHSQPMLELVPLNVLGSAQAECLANLDQYQHVIFISGNAVNFGMKWIVEAWPELPAVTWYAIGSATKERLRGSGVPHVHSSTRMTSESLLADPELVHVAKHRVLIVKGFGGRTSLRDELLARGAIVDEFNCYTRLCPKLAPGEMATKLIQWAPGLVLISSGEGFANMLSLLSPLESSKLVVLPLIVPSERIALLAKKQGFAEVHCAANASDAAMLEAVKLWWHEYSMQSGTGE
jgi:uroporphyrinogen-III synthase